MQFQGHVIEDRTPAEVTCQFFQSQRTDGRILRTGLPVICCISLHCVWPLPTWLMWMWLVWENEQKICFKFSWRIKSAWIYRLSHLCTCRAQIALSPVASRSAHCVEKCLQQTQSQFLSLSSGNLSDFPTTTKLR